MKKKLLLVPALAATLMLAACNTAEEGTEKNTADTVEQPSTDQTTNDKVEVETPADQEKPAAETPAEVADTVTEVKIYVPDANFENVVLGETKSHSLKNDGPLTKYIIHQLGLAEYYNTHTVSADEKTITLDFKESLTSSDLVQGSAGGWMLSGQIYASFFKTLPTLENLQLRIDGQEKDLDHISFSGVVTRENFLTAYPELAK